MPVPDLVVYEQGQTSVTADRLNTMAQTCTNVSQLRGIIGISGMEILIRGLSNDNDGGAGAFYWDANATGPDDGATVIVPTGSALGAWVRLQTYGASYAYQFPTTTALLGAFPNTITLANGTIASTAGRTAEGDGGGATFYYNSSDTTTADNGGTIRVDSAGRRWYYLQVKSELSALLFGSIGNGVFDCTTAIQKMMTYFGVIGGGRALFPPGSYVFSASVTVPSNVIVVSEGATMLAPVSWASQALFFDASGSTNVEFRRLKFNGGGTWTSTPFANPYSSGNSVGFTNNQYGVGWTGGSDIRVLECTFTGLGGGVQPINTTNCKIVGNTFSTIGNAAIDTDKLNYSEISENYISGVLGNLTAAGDTTTADSKFGDGIYVHRCSNVDITDNKITNCIRIGVVLEGDGVTLNTMINVVGNNISNMNSCRGTEINAAIWMEDTKSDNTCVISDNTCNNNGASAGANPSTGIRCASGVMADNNIQYFYYGFQGGHFTGTGNLVQNNAFGGSITQTAGQACNITGNNISINTMIGLDLQQSHGYHNISGNTFRDNSIGTVFSRGVNGAGLRISRSYNDQYLFIQGNKFISTSASTDTTGQLYGLYYVGGGDYSYSLQNLNNNEFIFPGSIAAYPTCMAATPVSMGYDNTSTITKFEIINELFSNNNNTKQPQVAPNTYATGNQRYVGQGTAAPIAGNYQQGDWLLNSNPLASGNIGWVCVLDGTPGTWKAYGTIAS